MKRKEPNHRLAAAMDRADCTNKALARAVRREGEARSISVRSDHNSVRRWLDGVEPQGTTPQLIAAALGKMLGQPITLADLGLSYADDVPSPLAISVDEGRFDLAAVGRLFSADLGGQRQLVTSPAEPSAWDSAIVEWIVATETQTSPAAGVSAIDVECVTAATRAFTDLDFRFGGGLARTALVQFLATEVAPKLPLASPSNPTGRAYLSAAASIVTLAGWMCYDTGAHGLSQHYQITALKLANAAGDATLGGCILADMSHQANYLGHATRARKLAAAARSGRGSAASPAAQALFHSMEARALASLGHERECTDALLMADASLSRSKPDDEPDRLAYFDEAELAGERAHCLFALGKPGAALQSVEDCASACADIYVRSMTFVRSIEAASLIPSLDGPHKDRDLDRALHVARDVVDTADDLKSVRPRLYVANVVRQMSAWRSRQDVADFCDMANDRLDLAELIIS